MFKKRRIFLLLLLILFLSFVLRVVAVKPGYSVYHPDEPVVYSLAMEMIKNRDFNPHRFDYPALSMYIHVFFYRIFFIPLELTRTFFLNSGAYLKNLGNFDEFIWTFVVKADHRQKVVFWARFLSALTGTLTVLMAYLFGKKAFGRKVGIITAFLLAINYRHLISSVLALPNVYNAFFMVTAFYFFLLLFEHPSRRRYLLSGILIGLTVGIKYQVMIFLPFGLVHFFASLRGANPREFFKKLFALDFFLALILAVVIFFSVNPYILIDSEEALRWIHKETIWYELGSLRLRTSPLQYLYKSVLGKLISWVVILGVFISLIKKKYWPQSFILISFIALFFFVLLIYTHGGIYGRNFTPLTPFLLVFSALGLVAIFGRSLLLLSLATIVVSLYPLKNTLLTSFHLSRPWNELCVKTWLRKNLPDDVKVGIVSPSPVETIERMGATWVFFDPTKNFTLPELQEADVNYLTINLDPLSAEFSGWINRSIPFKQIPVDILDNSLAGLSLKQLSRYSVKYCSKPWPVPALNYIIVKVPSLKKPDKLKLIANYSLDEKSEEFPVGWQVLSVRPAEIKGFDWLLSNNCYKRGCLIIRAAAGDLFTPIRFVSEAIPVEPGKKYRVEGWVKANNFIEGQRPDGFLRIDFYQNEELKGGTRGKVAAVSARSGKTGNWEKKWVEEVAPPKVKFMRISLQQESSTTEYLFDEIRVYETEASEEEKQTVVHSEVEDLLLYPEIIF